MRAVINFSVMAIDTTHRTEILLIDGHFVRRRIATEDLGIQEHLLADCLSSHSVLVKGVAKLYGKEVDMLVNAKALTLVTTLDHLPFKTWFAPNGPEKFVPAYRKAPGNILIEDNWTPPENCKLYFGIQFSSIGGRRMSSFLKPMLTMIHNGETYWLPYPNLFENCKVCMGDTWPSNETRGATNVEILGMAIRHFYETQMNSDLSKPSTLEVFAKKIDGAWNMTKTDDIIRFCQIVSIPSFDGYMP